jgi:hypothetical protein
VRLSKTARQALQILKIKAQTEALIRRAYAGKMADVMLAAVTPFLAKCEEYCPVDTGALKNSIRVQSVVKRRGLAIARVGPTGRPKREYAAAVEYGRPPSKTNKGVPPAAFLRRTKEHAKAAGVLALKRNMKPVIQAAK